MRSISGLAPCDAVRAAAGPRWRDIFVAIALFSLGVAIVGCDSKTSGAADLVRTDGGAGVSGQGAAGEFGGAGTGPSCGTPLGNDSAQIQPPLDTCSSAVAAPSGPIAFDATISCKFGGEEIYRVASTGDGAYVHVGDGPSRTSGYDGRPASQIAAFQAQDRISVVAAPPYLHRPALLVGPTGKAHLLGNSPGGPRFLRLDEGIWSTEIVEIPRMIRLDVPLDGAFTASGALYATYADCVKGLHLVTRTAAGVWSDLAVGGWPGQLVVDSRERPHVLRLDAAMTLTDWSPGVGASVLQAEVAARDGIRAAPFGEGKIAAAYVSNDGIHVLTQASGGVVREQVLANTAWPTIAGETAECPTPDVGREGPPRRCTLVTDGAMSPWLAGDGRDLWLAYLHQHVEDDWIVSCAKNPSGEVSCTNQILAERQGAEIVIVQLARDGVLEAQPPVRTRVPVPGTYSLRLSLESAGTRLSLAASWFDSEAAEAGQQTPWRLRLLTFDKTKL